MSCCTYPSLTTQSANGRDHTRWINFFWAFSTFVEAFHEALDMRRAAHRRYRLSDE